jgi:tetratricopeptide (TPR) repeat protein
MIGSRATAVLAVSALLANSAFAQPRQPSARDRQIASDLVKKAIARSNAGDHSGAIDIYLQAYTIVPNSILLSNIGAEFQRSGKPQEALRYFCMYLEKDPAGTNAPYAISQARSLQIQLGNSDVDDRDVCAPPRPRPRPRREPKAPPPEPEPEAPSKTVMRGSEPIDHVAPQGNPTLRYAAFATGIGGLVAVGVGSYAGLRAASISDQITRQDPKANWPNEIRDLQRRGQRYEDVQIFTLIGGGVLLTTGVVLYMLSRQDTADHAGDKTVRLVPTRNGVAVLGRF